MPLAARVEDALHSGGDRAAAVLTARLRAQATSAGWPSDVSAKLQVHHDAGSFEATFVGAEEWEFGTETRPPIAVARLFNANAGREANDLLTQALDASLRDLL